MSKLTTLVTIRIPTKLKAQLQAEAATNNKTWQEWLRYKLSATPNIIPTSILDLASALQAELRNFTSSGISDIQETPKETSPALQEILETPPKQPQGDIYDDFMK